MCDNHLQRMRLQKRSTDFRVCLHFFATAFITKYCHISLALSHGFRIKNPGRMAGMNAPTKYRYATQLRIAKPIQGFHTRIEGKADSKDLCPFGYLQSTINAKPLAGRKHRQRGVHWTKKRELCRIARHACCRFLRQEVAHRQEEQTVADAGDSATVSWSSTSIHVCTNSFVVGW